MKRTLLDFGVGAAGAGLTAVISIRLGLSPLGIAGLSIVVGIICIIISHYWSQITTFGNRVKSKSILIFRVLSLMKKVDCFSILQTFKADSITTIRIEKKVNELSSPGDVKYSPERFIFPYLLSVSVSPLNHGQKYLAVGCCFCSALPYHLELHKVSVHLIIKGIPIETQLMLEDGLTPKEPNITEPLIVYAGKSNERTSLQIHLLENQTEEVRKYSQQHNTVEACLRVTGFDKEGKPHSLETRQARIALLNGQETK